MNAAPTSSAIAKTVNAAVIGSSALLEHKTKACTHCRQVKPLDLFYRNKNKRDGHTDRCAECLKSYSLKYGRMNKQASLKRTADWRDKNRPWTREYSRQWAKQYPARRRETQNAWARRTGRHAKRYAANRAAILAEKRMHVQTLSDDYIRQRLTQKSSVLSQRDVPAELVAVKRIELQLKRIWRNQKTSTT